MKLGAWALCLLLVTGCESFRARGQSPTGTSSADAPRYPPGQWHLLPCVRERSHRALGLAHSALVSGIRSRPNPSTHGLGAGRGANTQPGGSGGARPTDCWGGKRAPGSVRGACPTALRRLRHTALGRLSGWCPSNSAPRRVRGRFGSAFTRGCVERHFHRHSVRDSSPESATAARRRRRPKDRDPILRHCRS